MLFGNSVKDYPLHKRPDVAEARKRVAMKRYLRQHGVEGINPVSTELLRSLTRKVRDGVKEAKS